MAHKFMHSPQEDEKHHDQLSKRGGPAVDIVACEKDRSRRHRTDFILSAEIIASRSARGGAGLHEGCGVTSIALIMTGRLWLVAGSSSSTMAGFI